MLNKAQVIARRKGIGGSDIPIIFGVSPYHDATWLMANKRGLIDDDDIESGDIDRGNYLEPYIRRKYQIATKNMVQTCDMLVSKEFELLIAHVDGIIQDDINPGVLEIKCPRASRYRKLIIEGLPIDWYLQLQHYLIVTGYKRADLIMFNCEDWAHHIFNVEPDKEIQNKIIIEAYRFWDCMKQDTDFIPKDTEIVEALDVPEGTFNASDRYPLEVCIEEFVKLQNERDSVTARMAELKQEILTLCADSRVALTEDLKCTKSLINSKNPYYKIKISKR